MEREVRRPLINILTRTSGRPRFFAACRSSLLAQTYDHWRHLISVDDEASELYVRAAGVPEEDIVRVARPERQDASHFPYNLYLNVLIEQVKEGWIMILDDDDLLMSVDGLERLVELLEKRPESRGSLVLWQVQFPNGRLVPRRIGLRSLHLGEVCCIGFAIHRETLQALGYGLENEGQKRLFGDRKGGDFLAIRDLSRQVALCWLPLVLTGINYQGRQAGGWGQRQDQTGEETPVQRAEKR